MLGINLVFLILTIGVPIYFWSRSSKHSTLRVPFYRWNSMFIVTFVFLFIGAIIAPFIVNVTKVEDIIKESVPEDVSWTTPDEIYHFDVNADSPIKLDIPEGLSYTIEQSEEVKELTVQLYQEAFIYDENAITSWGEPWNVTLRHDTLVVERPTFHESYWMYRLPIFAQQEGQLSATYYYARGAYVEILVPPHVQMNE